MTLSACSFVKDMCTDVLVTIKTAVSVSSFMLASNYDAEKSWPLSVIAGSCRQVAEVVLSANEKMRIVRRK